MNIAKRFGFGACLGVVGYFPNEFVSCLMQREVSKKSIDYSSIDLDVKIECVCRGVLLAPVYEEAIYRGFLQGVILQKVCQKCFSSILACGMQVLSVSCLFASLHWHKEYALLLGLNLG
ncbi:MAG TPA: CPBP family intramembrane glutamic endopeptidase [Chlamydiales bacterium]|nr:CPBP family intramembrane glutamic endopeptidase [Chlamydiales bacterium]